ncbi:MAG: adenylate kinase [Planctomycetota bacterium]
MKTVLILLGAPGAGKGTQAQRLSSTLELPHVSTGDLFRANLKAGTELGDRAKGFMNAGKLVPDELVLEMLFDRVSAEDCRDGYLLDGFPRTMPQAHALDARLATAGDARTLVLEIAVPDETVVERITGRRVCSECGNMHHIAFSPPRVEGVCDTCGGRLTQRDDDTEAVARERLNEYHRQTEPLIEHYRDAGVLTSVDGDRPPNAVFESLVESLPRDVVGRASDEASSGARSSRTSSEGGAPA